MFHSSLIKTCVYNVGYVGPGGPQYIFIGTLNGVPRQEKSYKLMKQTILTKMWPFFIKISSHKGYGQKFKNLTKVETNSGSIKKKSSH